MTALAALRWYAAIAWRGAVLVVLLAAAGLAGFCCASTVLVAAWCAGLVGAR